MFGRKGAGSVSLQGPAGSSKEGKGGGAIRAGQASWERVLSAGGLLSTCPHGS